jgi:hypothetical protein
MRDVPFAHTHLWNELPFEERKRLHPYMAETHILHLEQTRTLIVAHHNKTLDELDRQIENIKLELKK